MVRRLLIVVILAMAIVTGCEGDCTDPNGDPATTKLTDFIEFSGVAATPGRDDVQFTVISVHRGSLDAPQIAVTFGTQTSFFRTRSTYRVRAWRGDDGAYHGHLTTTTCDLRPRTTYDDGTAVNTSLGGAIAGRLPWVALVLAGVTVGFMLLFFILGRVRRLFERY